MKTQRGIYALLVASIFNVAAGVGIYYGFKGDAHCSPLAGILLRVLANFSCILMPMAFGDYVPKLYGWREGRELWLWGIFGALTLATYYYAVIRMGAGRTTVLSAASGVFISGLAPIIAKQKSSAKHTWLALGCLLGIVTLFYGISKSSFEIWGVLLAVLSGFFSALAYLMVARTRDRHRAETILLHWTVINLLALGCTFSLISSWDWPHQAFTWVALIAAALLMAWSQFLTTTAYQYGQASVLAVIGFLGPALNISLDLFVFKIS